MSLFLPKLTTTELVIDLLNTLYPDKEFELHLTNEKRFILPKGLSGTIKKTVIDFTGGFIQAGMSFELREHTEFLEVVPNVDPEFYNIQDPFEMLSVQFGSDDLFDPLQIIPQTDWIEYFQGVAALVKENWSTGAEKITKTSEKYFEMVFAILINHAFSGRQGIVSLRRDAEKTGNWYQKINIIEKIPQKIISIAPEQKEIIKRLVAGFTMLRILRNKFHHGTPGEIEICSSDALVSLMTLIHVHNELTDLLQLLGLKLLT